jgi:hypothetical protein
MDVINLITIWTERFERHSNGRCIDSSGISFTSTTVQGFDAMEKAAAARYAREYGCSIAQSGQKTLQLAYPHGSENGVFNERHERTLQQYVARHDGF